VSAAWLDVVYRMSDGRGMTLSMCSASVPVFAKMLRNARTWLDKAVAHGELRKFDPAVLLQSRLAPDMFPCMRQFQIATDHAKGCSARLAGIDVPKYEDTEQTIAELQARVDKTVAFIEGIDAVRFAGSETREIVLQRATGERRFAGLEYLQTQAMPNFWFHLTMGYAILRHNGVDVGKVDFLSGGVR
jgi:hypothetical protein